MLAISVLGQAGDKFFDESLQHSSEGLEEEVPKVVPADLEDVQNMRRIHKIAEDFLQECQKHAKVSVSNHLLGELKTGEKYLTEEDIDAKKLNFCVVDAGVHYVYPADLKDIVKANPKKYTTLEHAAFDSFMANRKVHVNTVYDDNTTENAYYSRRKKKRRNHRSVPARRKK
jgi:hypothetical protein